MIKLTKISQYQYSVNLSNGKFIGRFEHAGDRYFYWWPIIDEDGYFSAELILELANKLKELNKPYEEELRQKELEKIFGK